MRSLVRDLLLLHTGGGVLPFVDSFDRADGAINGIWTGAGATISGNKAIITPTEGGALGANMDMEVGDPPNNWLARNAAVLDGVADERTGGAGVQSIDVARNGNNNPLAQYNAAPNATVGQWYSLSGWARNVDATSSAILVYGYNATTLAAAVVGAAWTESRAAYCASQTYHKPSVGVYAPGADGTSGRGDDMIWKALTLSTLFASLQASIADVIAQVDLAVVRANPAGLVLNLDDAAAPANFVIAFHDGVKAQLWKCVAGTYTSVISANAVYAANATLRVVKSGTSYSLYYNGNQIGTTQTISDAGIINNTLHGLFSTYASNTMDDYRLERS